MTFYPWAIGWHDVFFRRNAVQRHTRHGDWQMRRYRIFRHRPGNSTHVDNNKHINMMRQRPGTPSRKMRRQILQTASRIILFDIMVRGMAIYIFSVWSKIILVDLRFLGWAPTWPVWAIGPTRIAESKYEGIFWYIVFANRCAP